MARTLLARFAVLPLVPWDHGRRDEVVRIALEMVTGRRAGDPVRCTSVSDTAP